MNYILCLSFKTLHQQYWPLIWQVLGRSLGLEKPETMIFFFLHIANPGLTIIYNIPFSQARKVNKSSPQKHGDDLFRFSNENLRQIYHFEKCDTSGGEKFLMEHNEGLWPSSS